MQAFVSRLYLTPVRDEEAESQRKAKSRHARQTRRSTQGVTLTDLREAQRTSSLSPQDGQTEGGGALDDRLCRKEGLADERRVKIGLTESTETEIRPKWSKVDEQGNIEPWLETLTEAPEPNLSYSSVAGSCALQYCSDTFRVDTRWQRDENQNPVEDTAQMSCATEQQQTRACCDGEASDYNSTEHDRLSRYDSSGETATDKPLGHSSSYTRRETRLAALNKQEQDSTAKDYKKMYVEALHENERLKSRLQDSKQELAKIRSQLEKVTQEKQALEKKVTNMEEDLKILTELKSDNQRLKDENGALIRVISKLSK